MEGHSSREITLTSEQMEKIAELAADKAILKMETLLYRQVGKGFLDKLLKLFSLSVIAFAIYLMEKGVLKIT